MVVSFNDSVVCADWPESWYDGNCRACPRLAGFLDEVKSENSGYFCKPVPPFGVSVSADDGLTLVDCRITNAVKCLPPQNKPVGAEEKTCNHFLTAEMSEPSLKIVLALGLLAHRSILRAYGMKLSKFRFGHNKVHRLDNSISLINSYHCSRYNTQTKRLTTQMFEQVFETIRLEIKLA
jgi:uracil-DNA glycosylase